MAAATTVKSLMFEVGAKIDSAVNRRMTKIDTQISQITESTAGLRNQFLFLSFGLLAAGGLMTRFGRSLKALSDTARDAFDRLNWSASIVSTTIAGTNEKLAEVQEKMIELGIRTQWTASQAGEAMQRLALAGFSAEEALGATEATLNLAAIGLTDVSTAATITVGVFRGFSYEAETAAEAAELMAGISSELAFAATHSATTVEELGEALKFTAAAADLVGWSLEEVTTVLMVAADNMVRAGIAGRALRRSFVQMNKLALAQQGITMTGAEAMKRYNVELLDSNGIMKGMIDIIEELQDAFVGVEEAEKNAALAAMFGTRAITLWSALMDENVDLLKQRELALKVAAAKEIMYMHNIDDTTAQLKKWRDEVEEGTSYVSWLADKLDLTIDSAMLLNDVIADTTLSQEMWNETVSDTAMGSEMLRERLQTLHGTMILMQSSLDAMWASIGQALAPIMIVWNRLIKAIADNLAGWPDWLKIIVGLMILLGGVMFTLIGKTVTLVGTMMMLVAALHMMNAQTGAGIARGQLFTYGMKLLRREILNVTRAVVKYIAKQTIMLGKMAIGVGIFYLFARSAETTGNQLYLLAGVAATAAYAYFMLDAKTKALIVSKTKLIATRVIAIFTTKTETAAEWANNRAKITGILVTTKATIVSGGLVVTRTIQTAITWGATAAQWALNAAMYASPIGWIIGLVLVLVGVLILLWQNLERVIEFFQWLWDVIVGFFEAIGNALGWFGDLIGGLIGHSVIPDYFAKGAKEIGQSLDDLEGRATGTYKKMKEGLNATFEPEVNARGVAAGGKRTAIVSNNFGDVTIGSMADAEEFGRIVDVNTTRALRRLEFELGTAKEGV